MPRRTMRSVAFAAGLIGLWVFPATARGPQASFMALAQEITPPRGFAAMCGAQPELCTNARSIHAGAGIDNGILENLHVLDRINRRTNRVVRQEADTRTYGRADLWMPAGAHAKPVGDCEDIAIEKRQQLIKAGFPADRLFLGVVHARRLGLHVVLVARTSSGDLVLDSRADAIRSWRDVPYTWIGAQSGQEPLRWFGIDNLS